MTAAQRDSSSTTTQQYSSGTTTQRYVHQQHDTAARQQQQCTLTTGISPRSLAIHQINKLNNLRRKAYDIRKVLLLITTHERHLSETSKILSDMPRTIKPGTRAGRPCPHAPMGLAQHFNLSTACVCVCVCVFVRVCVFACACLHTWVGAADIQSCVASSCLRESL